MSGEHTTQEDQSFTGAQAIEDLGGSEKQPQPKVFKLRDEYWRQATEGEKAVNPNPLVRNSKKTVIVACTADGTQLPSGMAMEIELTDLDAALKSIAE